MVTSWLLCSTPERAVQVQALARDIVLCSWARHLTLTVPLSIQVYKWAPANCWRNLTNCREVTCDRLASHPGKVEILLVTSCYRKWDKLRQLWAILGSKASLFFVEIGFSVINHLLLVVQVTQIPYLFAYKLSDFCNKLNWEQVKFHKDWGFGL